MQSWGGGLWGLLSFAMQMCLVMLTGYIVAVSPLFTRALDALARVPRGPRSAVAWMGLLSMTLGLLNWGVSIVGSAVLARALARRRGDVDYRLLVAAAYLGLGCTWHAGLSASAPMTVAAPRNDFVSAGFLSAPIPATATTAKRVDYAYERAGTANFFMFTEPLAGWREVAVRRRKTKLDWAIEMARLLEGRYAACEKVIVVCDNLNTHTIGAFYEAFEPKRARELVRRMEFCYTPKHGSWLNIAENELSSLTRQGVAGRRFGDIETLRDETTAWSTDVNQTQRGVDWQ